MQNNDLIITLYKRKRNTVLCNTERGASQITVALRAALQSYCKKVNKFRAETI